MKNTFRFTAIAILSSFIFILALFNFKLLNKPSDSSIYQQLQFLKEKRGQGEAIKMQKIFPEGFMFYEALYGLSWAEFLADPRNQHFRIEGSNELKKVTNSILSKQAYSTFQQNLSLKHGAFYHGWSTYFLSKKIGISYGDSMDIEKFKSNCDAISNAIDNSESPFIESYSNQYWPADMLPCIAALSNHDKVFEPKYNIQIIEWIEKVKKKLDANSLIPHSVNSDGLVVESARGSSQSLILSILPEIDSAFAQNQYNTFKKLFCDRRLGLMAIREYPKGNIGNGDIDSGPVIWEIGTAATLVGQKAAISNGDIELSSEIYRGVNSLGITFAKGGKRKFLFGYLPIADAFIAWSRTNINYTKIDSKIYWKFHIISGLIFILIFLVLIRLLKS